MVQKTLQFLRNLDPFFLSHPTGLPSLDRLIQIFQQPSLQQQHHPVKISSPPVLELTSANACSGKTQILYQMLTLALLPPVHVSISLGGKSSAVILFDLSGKLSLIRLHGIMTAHISSCAAASQLPPLSPEETEALIHASLLHLHIFSPQSSLSLFATLASLPSRFFSKPFTHFSASRPISAIILSNISAFNWQDRFQATSILAVTQSNPPASNITPKIDMKAHQRELVSTLRSLQVTFSCPIIATTSSFASPTPLPSTNHRILRPQMPAYWNAFVTAQLVVDLVTVPKFAPAISAHEATAERALRHEVVAKGERRAWINCWAVGGWREEVKEGVREWETEFAGGVRIWVADGVEIGELSGDIGD